MEQLKFKDTGERKFWESIVAQGITIAASAGSFTDPEDAAIYLRNVIRNVPLMADAMLLEKRKRDS